ncbi:MAG: hypothetical protein OEV68_07810, partial [candidate division Zixibacteria bacterium]|nr:hypothetical protein [candidate division Zixibacteria bacterium]
MSKPLMVYTKNFKKTKKEVEEKGGRILHRLGDSVSIVELPKPHKLRDLSTHDTKVQQFLDEQQKLIAKAWKATHACKGTELESLMTRSTREGAKWDSQDFKSPRHHDAGRGLKLKGRGAATMASMSTGTGTSLYMTDSVAVGVVVVGGDSWHRIPGGLKHVSVAADGTTWGVNSKDYIYRRVGNSWE